MTTVGPVCHIPPKNNINQPGPQNLPAIPPAQPNIQSLMNTVNALRQVVNQLTGRQGSQGPAGQAGAQGKPGTSAKGTWSEQNRQEETVKIYQNNDPSTGNYVEVKQINKLVMENKDTGQTWTWKR